MGVIHIQPAQFPKGEVADVQNYPPEAAANFEIGAALGVSSGEVVEATAAGVVAGELAGIGLNGTIAAGQSSSPAGTIGVAKAKNSQIYIGQVQAAVGSAPLTDLSGIAVGQTVGVAKSTFAGSLNFWVVLVGGTGFTVTRIDDDLDIVWFQALLATLDPAV